ncbi:MAG: polysaccharide biosynthesis C-terminal domain-containing protein [Bacteroidales bacterium]|nr:polysaccharide biosynthesis C-terminal domain-containing protein [Bacteroidales bacterium]MDY0160256.1 polysaccharide biosynthesis C-terminal domain-containing protein [Bacteroidales bacterium]
MANPIKQLAGQTAIYGLSSIIGRLLNYLLVPLYTRIFIPEIYGVVTELYAYATFLLILLTYGTETGFFRYAQDKSKFNTVFSSLQTSLTITSLLFFGLVTLFVSPLANALKYTANPEYIIYLAGIVALDALISIPFARLRFENKSLRFAIYRLLNIGINIGLNLFFLILCPKIATNNPDSIILNIWSPNIGVGYVFISNLVANIFTFLMFIPYIINVKYRFDLNILKQILWYSAPLLIGGFAGMINETIDRILLKFLLPESVNAMEQIGIYGANYKLAILMTLFIQMFRYAADPFFFAQKEKRDAPETYAKVMQWFVIFGLTIFLGVMFYIDIVKFFIDSSYHSGLRVVPILLLANLFMGMYYNLSIWYKLNDKTKFGAYLALFGAGVTIILNIILIPIIGYMGSAWATFACYFIMMLSSYTIGKKHYKIPYNIKKILKYFALALILYAISYIYADFVIWLRLILNSILMFVYLSVVAISEKIIPSKKLKLNKNESKNS